MPDFAIPPAMLSTPTGFSIEQAAAMSGRGSMTELDDHRRERYFEQDVDPRGAHVLMLVS